MGAKFGEIVVELGYITEDQIKEALERQRQGRYPLGQVLVHFGFITTLQVETVLAFQAERSANPIPFGAAAVHLGFIDQRQCDEAVKYQQQSKGVLGEILVHYGYITDDQRNKVAEMLAY